MKERLARSLPSWFGVVSSTLDNIASDVSPNNVRMEDSMRTSLHRLISLCVLSLFIVLEGAIAQAITSTGAGGNWEATGTWVGGVVPSSGSDVVIAGPVGFATGTGYQCRNLTVNSGGSLFNRTGYAWPDQILTVNGNVTNNGTLRNEGSIGLVLKVKGNITNNSSWAIRRIELSGTGTQTLSAASGKKFECTILVDATARPTVAASSDIALTAGFNLSTSTLNMNNYAVILYGGDAGVTNGSVTNAKDIVGYTVSSGNPVVDNVSYDGNPNIKGRIRINSLVTLKGNVTVTDTLENSSGYAHPEKVLKIIGNITNNGIIRNNGSNGLAVNITGNVTNNGSWVHNRTELSGTTNQVLTLATNKLFEAAFKVTDSLGMIVAGSNLATTSWFDLRKCALDMKSCTLTLQGAGASVYNGVVINTKDLVGKMIVDMYGTPILDNITYSGTVNLRGFLRVNSATLQGNVTVTDTVQNSSGYAHPEKFLKIVGSLANNGLVRNGGSSGLAVDVSGNVTTTKAFANNRILLSGIGNRTIVDKVSQASYQSTGEKVTLVGDNYLPNLSVAANSKCMLANGATIYTANGTLDPALDNWSVITTTRKFTGATSYSFFKNSINVLSNAAIDSVRIQSFGHQVPTSFAGAVKCYWRVRTFASNPKQSFSSMTFFYDDALLGTNTESALQVYQSQDSGVTWRQLSTTANTTRNTTANSITLTDAPGFGDYVISSTADPSSVRPSIIVSISGRNTIRIGGAPNRYTITYYNNSDSPTLDFLIPVMTARFVHIKSAEITKLDGRKEIFPVDSICYDGDDSSAVFWAAGMNPREERSFDVIVTSDAPPVNKLLGPDASALGKESEILVEPLTTAAAAAVTYVVTKYGAKIISSGIDYLGRKAEEATTPPPDQVDKFKLIFPNTHHELLPQQKKENVALEPVKKTGEKLSKILITKAMNITGGAYDIAASTIKAVKGVVPNLRARLWVWIMDDVGYFGVKETTDVEISSKSQKVSNAVRSWDPNEKIGPTGYGTNNYITSAGRMNYRILFENKKEASAPAWKVTIVDTLGSSFDPETVEFGATSHDSAQYTWKKTRTGSILRWEIEGIELPPNVVPPQGEGWVSFSVIAKSSLSSGTSIKNRATIVFDNNNPIMTNEFVNTLDYTPPKTTMTPIPTRMTASKLVVRWKGVDEQNGSGVQSYTLYAAKDSGAYQAIGSTNADSMTVNVDMYTHKYSFYALAKDNVGNVEITRPTPVMSDITNGVGETEETIPTEFALHQNYPNPFNPATEIAFSLSAKVRATLRIYDMLGREVATLVDEEKTPGKYTMKWDAGRHASGVYFYRLVAGDFVQTRKLMLVK